MPACPESSHAPSHWFFPRTKQGRHREASCRTKRHCLIVPLHVTVSTSEHFPCWISTCSPFPVPLPRTHCLPLGSPQEKLLSLSAAALWVFPLEKQVGTAFHQCTSAFLPLPLDAFCLNWRPRRIRQIPCSVFCSFSSSVTWTLHSYSKESHISKFVMSLANPCSSLSCILRHVNIHLPCRCSLLDVINMRQSICYWK